MTKRRWLKTAIEEAKKPQAALPWQRTTTRVAPEAISAAQAKRGKPAHA